MRMQLNRVLALAGMTGALAMAASSAGAQTGADFYKDKTVTYIAATSPGGGYDLYGRLVAEFMQKHLPGSTFVVKNVPGAGHIVGANTIYASAGRADDRDFQYRPDLQPVAGGPGRQI